MHGDSIRTTYQSRPPCALIRSRSVRAGAWSGARRRAVTAWLKGWSRWPAVVVSEGEVEVGVDVGRVDGHVGGGLAGQFHRGGAVNAAAGHATGNPFSSRDSRSASSSRSVIPATLRTQSPRNGA